MNKKQGSIQKQIFSKFIKGAQAIVIGLALFLMPLQVFAMTQAEAQAEIDRLNAESAAAQAQITQLQGKKRTLSEEISLFNSQIYQLQLQINSAQKEIDLTTIQISNIGVQITQAESDLKIRQAQLGEIMRVMYEDGQVSNIELIAKSQSFSEFLDRSEYIEVMQLNIKENATKILDLKNELDSKKKEMETKRNKAQQLKSETLSQRTSINIKKQQKDYLLVQTNGSESAYQSVVNSNNARMGILHCIAAGGCQSVANGDLVSSNTPLYYNQTSSPWGSQKYAPCWDCTYANYGCLITSLAMAHGVTPPVEASRHSFTYDGYMIGSYGQNVTGNWTAINLALSQGKPVIFGLYLNSYGDTHFVLAKSTSGGKYYINDPYFGTNHAYSISQVYKAVIPW